MTLQSSGQIKFSDVQTEFGGANPIRLTEYYGAAGGLPVSGQIKLSDFYGKSSIPPNTVTVTPGFADSGFNTFYGKDSSSRAGGSNIGSVSPSTVLSLPILSLMEIGPEGGGFGGASLFFIANGTGFVQGSFTSLTLKDVNGISRTFNTASAVFSHGSPATSQWAWTSAAGIQLFNIGVPVQVQFA